ncbi:MAG: chaperone modulatory protein CbpM [Hahellaceae bacterium]|jgi:chaperone modulatory protein CbpM|nr:chaperone modulatory protein CbpM [Hahellaceae bacterium]
MSEKSFSISFDELCEIEGIESQLIVEIVEYEIVTPLNKRLEETTEHQWLFDTASIYWIQKALRLHHDLEIDWVAVAMLIDLMQQKEALLKENRKYEQQLKRFITGNIV